MNLPRGLMGPLCERAATWKAPVPVFEEDVKQQSGRGRFSIIELLVSSCPGPHIDSHGLYEHWHSCMCPSMVQPAVFKKLVMSEQRKQMFPQNQGASPVDPSSFMSSTESKSGFHKANSKFFYSLDQDQKAWLKSTSMLYALLQMLLWSTQKKQ